MPTYKNPDGVHTPLGAYHHTASIPAGARWLSLAGQIGVDPAGNILPGFRAQAEQVFRNIRTCLEASGFEVTDLVRLTIFIVDRAHLEDMRAARNAVFGTDVQPPSTLLIVAGLASPDLQIEVEAMAARG